MTNAQDRAANLDAFLTLAGWGSANRVPLAGDASNRRYERLSHPSLGPAVLMDAPPSKGEDIRPFTKIASHLSARGLSAPKIFGQDAHNGFLLLEDLGDDLFARLLEDGAADETELYLAAVDAMIEAAANPPDDLPNYGPSEMAEAACLVPDWYLPYATGKESGSAARSGYKSMVEALLQEAMTANRVLVQRDYHAENLLWLPARSGAARVGLLDFQDAALGDPAYDLASLLKDARRDVSPATQEQAIRHFLARTGADERSFKKAYATCSAQRNLRILGVFARLCIRDGKPHYPDLMPRVWRNLMDDLTHPDLSELRGWVEANLPAPNTEIIARIKASHV